MKPRPANSKQIPFVTVCIWSLALEKAAANQDRKNLPHGFERVRQMLDHMIHGHDVDFWNLGPKEAGVATEDRYAAITARFLGVLRCYFVSKKTAFGKSFGKRVEEHALTTAEIENNLVEHLASRGPSQFCNAHLLAIATDRAGRLGGCGDPRR